jgi:hypothetical protein
MNRDTILQRSDDVTFQTVAGEAILIRMDTGAYFSLNPVGTDFWEMLDGRAPIAEHAAAIASKYNHKSDELAAAIITLAQEKADTRAQQALADEYDVEIAFIQEQMAQLSNAPVGEALSQYQQAIAETFYVSPTMVQADLLELAQTMFADQLITVRHVP